MTKLMDKELNMVAGGDLYEVMDDSIALNVHSYMSEYFDDVFYLIQHWDHCSSAVDAGWKNAGVTSVTRFMDSNTYFIDGKEVSRYEAFKHAGMNN